jgi:hypothetical protein
LRDRLRARFATALQVVLAPDRLKVDESANQEKVTGGHTPKQALDSDSDEVVLADSDGHVGVSSQFSRLRVKDQRLSGVEDQSMLLGPGFYRGLVLFAQNVRLEPVVLLLD